MAPPRRCPPPRLPPCLPRGSATAPSLARGHPPPSMPGRVAHLQGEPWNGHPPWAGMPALLGSHCSRGSSAKATPKGPRLRVRPWTARKRCASRWRTFPSCCEMWLALQRPWRNSRMWCLVKVRRKEGCCCLQVFFFFPLSSLCILWTRTSALHHLAISWFKYSLQKHYVKFQGVDRFSRCQTLTDVVIKQLNCLGQG